MGKEKCKQQTSVMMWILVAGLALQNLVIPVMATATFEDQKNYYSPDPHPGSPPTGSHGGHSHVPAPSHGGGSYGGSPPSHSTPSTPTPSPGNCGTPPSTPSNPPSGGYYPPTPTTPTPDTPTPVTPTPVTPTPVTPTPYVPTPTPPTPRTPPYGPSPPFIPDPNTPFTCNYWRTHPGLIWGVLGWWGTLGNAFGVTSMPGFATSMSLQQALSNTRTDGYGTLYREGTASFLNSMVTNKFPFTTKQVRENFVGALGSNKAAAAQGHQFKLANEGKLKPRN